MCGSVNNVILKQFEVTKHSYICDNVSDPRKVEWRDLIGNAVLLAVMLLASGTPIPTIAGTIEEEYAQSEANSGPCDGNITDHTDLNSEIDIDGSEYQRELLNDVSITASYSYKLQYFYFVSNTISKGESSQIQISNVDCRVYISDWTCHGLSLSCIRKKRPL